MVFLVVWRRGSRWCHRCGESLPKSKLLLVLLRENRQRVAPLADVAYPNVEDVFSVVREGYRYANLIS